MLNPPIVPGDTPVHFPNFKKGVCSIAVVLLFAKGKVEILERIFKFHGVTLPSTRYDSKSPMWDSREKWRNVTLITTSNMNRDRKNTMARVPERLVPGLNKIRSWKTFAVFEHCRGTGHNFELRNAKISTTADHTIQSGFKENTSIKQSKLSLKKDKGMDLPVVYDSLPGMAQWWEHSPPTNVTRVWFPDSA